MTSSDPSPSVGPSDEELVAAIRAGDRDSLGILALRWERPLYRFVYRLVPRADDALDVCQETFLRILDKAHRFEPGSRFSTWMYQIALNLCRDQKRKRGRWKRILADDHAYDERRPAAEPVAAFDDPARHAERRQAGEALRLALTEIPPEQREVLILKEFEGLKFREIAEILACPESTVKSRLYYGLTGLRTVLERRGVHGA